jgi:sterol desaturase/sphingolipid hydroxylase (fatty acid hydroxylase superfamily)
MSRNQLRVVEYSDFWKFLVHQVDSFVCVFVLVSIVFFTLCRYTGHAVPLRTLHMIEVAGILERTAENFVAWFTVYGTVYFCTYGPTRKVFTFAKLNREYPAASQVMQEICWSALSVVAATVWQVASDLASTSQEVTFHWRDAFIALALYVWADFHFYWQHRAMHSRVLFRFHKIHHRSKNTNPWSGLSFHPVESAVYFSPSLVFIVWPVMFSYTLRRGLHFGLLLIPCRGHHGFGNPNKSTPEHYVHHTKFNYNFGASIDFDCIFGTRSPQ